MLGLISGNKKSLKKVEKASTKHGTQSKVERLHHIRKLEFQTQLRATEAKPRDKGVARSWPKIEWHKTVLIRNKGVPCPLSHAIKAWHGRVFSTAFTFLL